MNNAQNLIMDKITPLMQKSKPLIIAIDGKCASGKTSIAQTLTDLYSNAVVIHMDDFFLPPELRSEERYAQPGGNVHYERFLKEVAENLWNKIQTNFSYRIFDCSIMGYNGDAKVEITPDTLVIVEGAYSLRPDFRYLYDLKIFMDISPEKQKQRIIHRNGEDKYEMFEKKWIPLEERYFDTLDIINCCDLVIDN